MTDNADAKILKIALDLLTETLDNLVGECLDGNEIKAPSKRAIIDARKMLPSKCKNTLTK